VRDPHGEVIANRRQERRTPQDVKQKNTFWAKVSVKSTAHGIKSGMVQK